MKVNTHISEGELVVKTLSSQATLDLVSIFHNSRETSVKNDLLLYRLKDIRCSGQEHSVEQGFSEHGFFSQTMYIRNSSSIYQNFKGCTISLRKPSQGRPKAPDFHISLLILCIQKFLNMLMKTPTEVTFVALIL